MSEFYKESERMLQEHYAKEKIIEANKSGLATLVQKAQYQLLMNQECFVAQWIIQNPEANIQDYRLCYQPDFTGVGVYSYWMEKKCSTG